MVSVGRSADNLSADGNISDWRRAVACRGTDPDLFFPVTFTGRSLPQIAQVKGRVRGMRSAASVPGIRARHQPDTRDVGRHDRRRTQAYPPKPEEGNVSADCS
jgi:hypothetical protein